MSGLTELQKTRYERNILIPQIGLSGQERISQGRVLVVGTGGLGSPALWYLAAAGVGTVGMVDSDRVELSNLQRQILHWTADIDRLKTDSAWDKLTALNPDVRVNRYADRFTMENGRDLVRGYDFVIEATDNFESKFVVNDVCVREGVPYSHAGILGMFGQVMTVVPGKGPCYRCIFKEAPEDDQVETTSQVGVLGTVPGVLGSIQASEAIKFLVGCGELLVGRLLMYDALASTFRHVPLPPPSCDICRGMVAKV